MNTLHQRIMDEGRNLGRGILKVDSFLNHQTCPCRSSTRGGRVP